jgi:hypothetical protein
MDFATNGAVKFDEINTGEKQTQSDVYAISDPDFYALGDSTLSGLNKVQKCQAKLPIEKQGGDSDIFTTYTAYLQARIYASKDDTAPLNLSETTFEITLEAPVYEAEEFDPYDESWVDEYENEFFIQHEEYLSAWVLVGNVDKEITQSVWIDRWDNKEYTRPDVLDFTFNA